MYFLCHGWISVMAICLFLDAVTLQERVNCRLFATELDVEFHRVCRTAC